MKKNKKQIPGFMRNKGNNIFITDNNGKEQLFGVPPEATPYRDSFTVHKSSKKGQNSFRITKSLLDSLFETYKTIQKKPILVITITDGSDEYTLTCTITKK